MRTAPTTVATATGPLSVAVGEFNGDGDPDLAVADQFSGRVLVLLGSAGATFTGPTTVASGSDPVSVAVADFNLDGKPDLTVTNFNNDNVSVLVNSTVTNRAPVAADDAYSTAEDTILTVAAPGVLTNDSDPDGNPLTAVLVSGPSHGSSRSTGVGRPCARLGGAAVGSLLRGSMRSLPAPILVQIRMSSRTGAGPMSPDRRLVPRLAGYGQRLAAWRGVPPLVVDAMLVVACYLTIVIDAVLDDRLEWWVVLLAAINTVPLLWRRRYPLLVAMIVGISTGWLDLAYKLIEIPAASLVATYTFAALSPPLKRLVGIVSTVIGVTVSITVPGDKLINLGPNAIAFVVAYALGTSARARRAQMEMLEERARRLAEEQEAAATRERQRIAREMHDILAHSMSLVVVQAESGPVAVRSDPDRAEEVFDNISATAREALTQLRRTLNVLRSGEPERQPQPGLEGLSPLVASVRRAGLAASLEEHGARRPVAADLALTAYRIVQESLTNAVKHAQADNVSVRLEWLDSALNLEIRDDGRGTADDGRPAGRGLVGMRERVSAAGGELTCGPGADGVGYRVAASLPLQ